MAKIKTDDLPVDEALSEEEMRETRGGSTILQTNETVASGIKVTRTNLEMKLTELSAFIDVLREMTKQQLNGLQALGQEQQAMDAKLKEGYGKVAAATGKSGG